MKRCPQCKRVYADQTLNFCLEDGALLSGATDPNAGETARSASDAPTEVLRSEDLPHNAGTPTLPSWNPQPVDPVYRPPQPRPAGQGRKILLMIVFGVLLMSVAVMAYLLVRKESKKNPVDVYALTNNTNSANANTSPVSTASVTPVPTATPSPSATPSASPTPTPNMAAARSDVMAVMGSWAESLRKQDLGSNLRLYADYLDAFYQLGSASREQVRTNRQAIFARYYSSTDVQLSNISIEFDSSGTKATVTYDNDYNWRGGAKYLTGKSHNMMIISRVGLRWLITSEKHLKTYYENNGN